MKETIILNEVKTVSMPTNQGGAALQEQPEKKKNRGSSPSVIGVEILQIGGNAPKKTRFIVNAIPLYIFRTGLRVGGGAGNIGLRLRTSRS